MILGTSRHDLVVADRANALIAVGHLPLFSNLAKKRRRKLISGVIVVSDDKDI